MQNPYSSKTRFIAFFGPDGSGKSTLVKNLKKDLKKKNKKVVLIHWRPRVLPSLKQNYKTLKFNKPDQYSQRNYLLSFVCYIYFFLDFFIAEKIIFRKYLNDNKIIFYERYFYDVLLHPNRYKLKEINWLGLILSKILKKPSVSILLKGNPSIIYKRKKELTPKKIKKQINLMLKIIPVLSKTLIFDVGKQNSLSISKAISKLII